MRVYVVLDNQGYIRAYTKVHANDWSDDELTADDIVSMRLEAAIADGYLSDEHYEVVEQHYKNKQEAKEDLKALKYLETHWCEVDKINGIQSTPYVVEI